MLNPLHYWVALRDRWMIGGLRYCCYVAVSSRIADELNQLYAVPYSRIAVIPNGIDLVRFTPEPGIDADVRKEFAIPASARLLLFVGHEFERKGLAPVIEALSLLPEAHLLIVGSDDRAPYPQNGAGGGRWSTGIRFAGARADMPRLDRDSRDVFGVPDFTDPSCLFAWRPWLAAHRYLRPLWEGSRSTRSRRERLRDHA